jgi:F-type H+-transporting ATPase subunit epsilon
MELLHLEIVTPEGITFDDDVQMVVAPAQDGDVGIMPHHSAIIAMLRAGLIEVHNAEGKTMRYYVDGGYVNMSHNRCIILAEAIVEAEKLTKTMLAQEIVELKAEIAQEKCSEVQREKLQARLIEAENAMLIAQN